MLISTSFLLFAVHIRSVVSGIWEPSGSKREEVCRTEDCLARGKEFFDNLSPAVHPCNDFYTFACGAWYTNNKPPTFTHEWTVHNVMEQNLLKELGDTLDQPSALKSDKDLADVKYYCELCSVLPSYGRFSPKEIKAQISKIGRAKNKKIWDIHQGYFELTGESAFFDYEILSTDSKDKTPALMIEEMDSPFGAVKQNQWKSQEISKYVELLYEMVKTLDFPKSHSIKISEIEDVANFRNALNKIINRYKSTDVTNLSFEDFLLWQKKLEKQFQNAAYVKVPWEKIMKVVFPKVRSKDLNKRTIMLSEENYFDDLYFLLSTSKERTIVNHMELYFIERHLQYTDIIEDRLEKVVTNPDSMVRRIPPRWERCLTNGNVWEEIRRILEKKHRSVNKSILEIVDGLKNTIVNEVKKSSWMDETTKKSTIKKIESVRPQTDRTFSFSDDRMPTLGDVAAQDPISANAHFNMINHNLYINPPLFRPSIMFNPNLPKLYNYGGIGYVLGHELYHVFYECGVYFDENEKAYTWFSPKMRDICQRKMKCFANSYKEIVTRELSEKHYTQPKIDTMRTLSEDYADVMGLDAAYLLYKAEKKNKNVCKTLPRFEKYTCDQMFFISFANTFCGTISPAAAHKFTEEGEHSIDSARVNGAVANNDYFHAAFGCPVGKPMNPPKKCNLLK